MPDNETTRSTLEHEQIWRTTIPGNIEPARLVQGSPVGNAVIFVQLTGRHAQIANSRRQVTVPEWWEWVDSHKAKITAKSDLGNPPGQEP